VSITYFFSFLCDSRFAISRLGHVSQDGAGNQRDDDDGVCLEVHQEENLSGPPELPLETLPEEEGIDVALVTAEKKLSCSNTQSHEAHKSRQGVSSKDSKLMVKRGISGI